MNAVAVAIRKSDPVVTRGAILELGLALVDIETGVLSEATNWIIKPLGFEANMQLARLSVAMNFDGEFMADNGQGLATAVMLSQLSANEAVQLSVQWWDLYVRTTEYTEPKPTIIGFNPEVSRLFLNHWFPELGKRLGQAIDLPSACWARKIEVPEIPSRVMPELTIVGDLVKTLSGWPVAG